jgi:hypothetical protein
MRINEAPLNEKLTKEDKILDKVWLQWFATLSNQIKGLWVHRPFKKIDSLLTGVTYSDANSYIDVKVNKVNIALTFDDYVGSGSSNINIGYNLADSSILSCYDIVGTSAVSISNQTVSGQNISLPSSSHNKLLVKVDGFIE